MTAEDGSRRDRDHPLRDSCATTCAPDYIHVMMAGRIVGSGGPELADRVEAVGYEGLADEARRERS